MPMLDVSFMTADPMLADTFTVTRRPQVMSTKGRAGDGVPVVTANVVGVVTQEEPADLMKNPDAQFARKRIFVATQMLLYDGNTTGYRSDVLTWNGCDYHVVKVLPYSRFGAGICEVIAENGDATAPAGT